MAYSVKELGEALKAEGLEAAEETAKAVLKALDKWAAASAAEGKNGVVDIVVAAAVPMVVKFALEQAEKINPADNA